MGGVELARQITLPEPWKTVVIRLGGVKAATRALGGVAPSTLYRWAHGLEPRGPAKALILIIFKQHKVSPPKFGHQLQ